MIEVQSFGWSVQQHLEAATRFAEANTQCERKGVAAILGQRRGNSFVSLDTQINGPAMPEILCGGVEAVGTCGCMHAEVKVILRMLEDCVHHRNKNLLLVTSYSPCSNCASAIVTVRDFIKGVIYGVITEHDKRGIAHLQHHIPCLCVPDLMRPTSTATDIATKWKEFWAS